MSPNPPEPLPIRLDKDALLKSIEQNAEETGIPKDLDDYNKKIKLLFQKKDTIGILLSMVDIRIQQCEKLISMFGFLFKNPLLAFIKDIYPRVDHVRNAKSILGGATSQFTAEIVELKKIKKSIESGKGPGVVLE
jgi:hypothetical protein